MLSVILGTQTLLVYKEDVLATRNHAARHSCQFFKGRTARPVQSDQSRVNKLPTELLLEILLHCVGEGTGDGLTNANGKTARALAQVSNLWRSLVFSKAVFWVTIDLDTIRPRWFLELLDRAGSHPISLFSKDPVHHDNEAGIHVWSIAHANFDRCSRIHVHATVDVLDARCLGRLLSHGAPSLIECVIQYIPTDDLDAVYNLSFAAAISRNKHQLFRGDAPLLRSLHLVDCHFPQYQDIFPSIQHFHASVTPENDQSDYLERKGLADIVTAILPLSQLTTLILNDAIYDGPLVDIDQFPKVDVIPLPNLHEFKFTGAMYAAAYLLRIIHPSSGCSFRLSLNASELHSQSTGQFSSNLDCLFRPILSINKPYFWKVGLKDCVLVLQVEDRSGFTYDLLLEINTTLGLGPHPLDVDALWAIHARRVAGEPSICPVEIAFSCMLRSLTSNLSTALQAARTLEVHIPYSHFALLQTTHILERMGQLTEMVVPDCRTLSNPTFYSMLIPSRSPTTVLLPRLQRIVVHSSELQNKAALPLLSAYKLFRTIRKNRQGPEQEISLTEIVFGAEDSGGRTGDGRRSGEAISDVREVATTP